MLATDPPISETFPKLGRGRPRVTSATFDRFMPGVVRGKSRRSLVNVHYLSRAVQVLEAANICPKLRDIDHNRRLRVMYELGRAEPDELLITLAQQIERDWQGTTQAIRLIHRARKLWGESEATA